jgi:hypothetical protein
MTNATPAAGRRVREVHPDFAHTKAYHALYLPTDWKNDSKKKYPLIVEYMGNGPWSGGFNHEDISTGRPEDSNLGYGIGGGDKFLWISMPLLSSDMGADTEISTYWWGCPSTNAAKSCGNAYNITPTLDYTKKTVQLAIDRYGADPDNIIATGWSRGAIACGAIALHDDEIARLWRAFIPYSHVDGDCGWVDDNYTAAADRFKRLKGRPQLHIGEKCVATQGAPAFIQDKLHLNLSDPALNLTFMTTGWTNHDDKWILRPGKGRDDLRTWLDGALV